MKWKNVIKKNALETKKTFPLNSFISIGRADKMYHFLFFLSVFSKDVFYRNFQEIEFYRRKVSLAPMRGFQLKILASIGKYS